MQKSPFRLVRKEIGRLAHCRVVFPKGFLPDRQCVVEQVSRLLVFVLVPEKKGKKR
jgi:hypothetical protein